MESYKEKKDTNTEIEYLNKIKDTLNKLDKENLREALASLDETSLKNLTNSLTKIVGKPFIFDYQDLLTRINEVIDETAVKIYNLSFVFPNKEIYICEDKKSSKTFKELKDMIIKNPDEFRKMVLYNICYIAQMPFLSCVCYDIKESLKRNIMKTIAQKVPTELSCQIWLLQSKQKDVIDYMKKQCIYCYEDILESLELHNERLNIRLCNRNIPLSIQNGETIPMAQAIKIYSGNKTQIDGYELTKIYELMEEETDFPEYEANSYNELMEEEGER